MKRRLWVVLLCMLLAFVVGTVALTIRKAAFAIDEYASVHRLPAIRPDYVDTVIPPNIAPLNFWIQEPGTHYRVNIHSATGKQISILSRSASIIIPPAPWKELLEANRGQELRCDVYARNPDGHWTRFGTITNTIAREDIDSHVAYRLIKPGYNYWGKMGLYQRNLTNYDQSLILHNESFGQGCLNCHSFCNNSPDTMSIDIRSRFHGVPTLLVQDGSLSTLGTKFAYNSWHPSGQLIVYALTKVKQFFHLTRYEVRDVVDLDSDLLYYQVDSQTVKTCKGISDPDLLETYPSWSPDGRYLYFCSAPITWTDPEAVPPEGYDEILYDLMRISYDIATDTWGELETVLSSDETGLCVMLPRISPDGRFLLFCMCDYGCFPIFQPSSDLYMMDLRTRQYRPLVVNSERSESWHSWSTNNRWIAFSSKMRDGLFTRLYLSYVDEAGEAHKAFIMPQKDPTFDDSFLKTYSVPELITGPIQVSPSQFTEAVHSAEKIEVEVPVVSMTRKPQKVSPWRSGASEQK